VEIPQGGAEGVLHHAGRPLRRLRLLCTEEQAGLQTWNLVDLKRVRWRVRSSRQANTCSNSTSKRRMGAATMAFGSYAGIGQAARER